MGKCVSVCELSLQTNRIHSLVSWYHVSQAQSDSKLTAGVEPDDSGKTGFLAPDIKGPFINYGELGGLQNRRGWGESQVLPLQKKRREGGGGRGRKCFGHAERGLGEHKKC